MRMNPKHRGRGLAAGVLSLAGGLLLGACAPATTVPDATGGGATQTPEQTREQAVSIPAGFGSLRQDEISLSLRVGDLLLRVTPLEESVIRLAAPDTYERLRATADSRREEARQAVYSGEPELVLVSFFSYSPDVAYSPEDVQLMHQGRTMRPIGILGLASGWGRGRLQQQEAQSAVYVFEGDIDYSLPLTVRYGSQESGNWSAVIPALERERARVRARSGS